MEVDMTNDLRRISVMALGVAAFVSFSAVARADTAEPASTAGTSSDGAEPAPTPRDPGSVSTPMPPERPAPAASRHYARHAVWRNGHGYTVYRSRNPVGEFAYGVVGGVADLGSMAAYPFYCFPDYGACRVRLPYRP
jgi:hypothetical protein